ncbi:hypothetical protein NE237_022725 [Protea cynaroides]|uniref:Patatin n=1 Tax=Protea cynaroides TaxID=273540 RepID=A0A9Q0HCJ7_9MAGN|nr:hypothetical protein NE237_022725 [Protea cynaroides]
MAASGSLCSLLVSRPHSFFPPISDPNTNINTGIHLRSRNQNLQFSVNSESKNKNSDSPIGEKKSLAVATGELFIGLVSRFIIRKNENGDLVSAPITMFGENSLDSEVFWEQRLKEMEADRDLKNITSLGFSFSPAGLLMPYHLGAAQFLIEKGYIKETTPLAGSSAGAIVCAVIASGASMEDALKATKIFAEDCRRRGTIFRLGAVLKSVLHKFLPDDVHSRSNGRIRVAVTQILWRPKCLLVDQFDSKEDFIDAVITSSFIPGYLAPSPAIIFRNRLCVDGGFTLFMPPTSADHTVRVCAFPADKLALKGIVINPNSKLENMASPSQVFQWLLEPAEDHILDRLFELGYLDAAAWAEQNLVGEAVEDQSNPN